MFFAGTPLLSDPQNPIWYLPNIIFLFANIDTAIFISLFIHTLFGSVGIYILSREVFKFSKRTNIILACLFILSPIYFSYLEAGHWGLAIAWSWLPYLLLSTYMLLQKPNWKMVILFAISASSLYFNHILIAAIFTLPIFIYWFLKKISIFRIYAFILTLLFISPAFYYQISWQSETTRHLLFNYPETFPIWKGKREFVHSFLLFNPETEKAITFGIIPGIIAGFGFLKLKTRQKLLVLLILLVLLALILNNVSPIYHLLLTLKPFILMRVSTRIWPIVFFIFLFLFGKGLEHLSKRLAFLLGILAIVESTLIGYSYIAKPISARENIPPEIYKIFEKDKSDFRVFCLTRCIPQKEAAFRGLKLVEGYGTLQEKTYFDKIQKTLNTRWDKYTLSVPPFEAYLYQELQPNAKLLREFNTKYVISKYILRDSNFFPLGKFGEYYLYLIP